MKQSLTLTLLVFSLAACGEGEPQLRVGEQSSPIRNGSTTFEALDWAGAEQAIGRLGTYCTGTLISPHTVLTAAHCVCSKHSGADLEEDCNDRATMRMPNADVIGGDVEVPPEFSQRHWFAYDYALIRLDTPYEGVAPLPISEYSPAVGNELRIAGYGFSDEDCDAASGALRNAMVELSGVTEDWSLRSTDGTYSICPGDSGGPAIAEVNGRLEIVGVNSWSNPGSNYKTVATVYDWLLERMGPKNLPKDTWGHCVAYRNGDPGGSWISFQGGAPFTGTSAWMDDEVSRVWVKKGYRARLYDSTAYGSRLRTLDGFNGAVCNEFGCMHDLRGTSADDRAGSITCTSVAPRNTWGHCVYYVRKGKGAWLSARGDVDLTERYTHMNNRISTVWVKQGHQARLYARADYSGPLTTLTGFEGDWCNAYGCLHDLEGRLTDETEHVVANTTTSVRCD